MLGVSDIDIGHAYVIILMFAGGLFLVCTILLKKGIGIRE